MPQSVRVSQLPLRQAQYLFLMPQVISISSFQYQKKLISSLPSSTTTTTTPCPYYICHTLLCHSSTNLRGSQELHSKQVALSKLCFVDQCAYPFTCISALEHEFVLNSITACLQNPHHILSSRATGQEHRALKIARHKHSSPVTLHGSLMRIQMATTSEREYVRNVHKESPGRMDEVSTLFHGDQGELAR
jgi:hypothetical protein